jgi:hypothetical protein
MTDIDRQKQLIAQVESRQGQVLNGLKQLQVLDLTETGITDTGLAYLAHLSSLRQLNLSRTKIQDNGRRFAFTESVDQPHQPDPAPQDFHECYP